MPIAKRYLPVLLIFLILLSCDKLDKLLTFSVNDSVSFTIPSYTILNAPVTIPTPGIQSTASNTYSNNNTKASLIKDVYLNKLDLLIISPEKKTFSFLKSIAIYISAEGEAEIMLANISNLNDDVENSISLIPSGKKLDAYLRKENYILRTVVELKELPVQDIRIKADIAFQVTAKTL